MRDRALFAYAYARLQAHHGRRPTKSTWRHLNASKSLGHYLESARQTGLGPWVDNLTAATGTHEIEHALRRDWRDYVCRVASWLPREWQHAVLWTGGLADLPMDVHRQRGLEIPTWADQATPDGDVMWLDQDLPMANWLERFAALWPRASGTDVHQMEGLLDLLRRHLAPNNPEYLRDGVEARYQLIARLERLFHRTAQRPVAVFAFLAMVALDIEHLRAHMVHRRLFPETLDNR